MIGTNSCFSYLKCYLLSTYSFVFFPHRNTFADHAVVFAVEMTHAC